VLWHLGLPLDEARRARRARARCRGAAGRARWCSERIATRKPAAYLTREAWLQGVPFYVDERAIVPRSFIAELLADGSIDPWLSERTQRVLDLCTGNGSLAVLAAMAYPDVRSTRPTSRPTRWRWRASTSTSTAAGPHPPVQSDGLAALPGPYDLILCNPPYVNSASMAALPAEYRPSRRWRWPAAPTAWTSSARCCATRLPHEPDGVLVLEIGNERAHFEAAFPRLEAVWLETSAGDDQVLLLTREALAIP
jgi:ribosomal protein L3 glutamine methyltransferase